MLLELVQLMYTAHYILNRKALPEFAYRPFNPNHPTAVWIRSSFENYTFAAKFGLALTEEYTYRYSKIHSCDFHIRWLSENFPPTFKAKYNSQKPIVFGTFEGCTPVPLAMPDDCFTDNAIQAYRRYYNRYKRSFAVWTSRPTPYWYVPVDIRQFF